MFSKCLLYDWILANLLTITGCKFIIKYIILRAFRWYRILHNDAFHAIFRLTWTIFASTRLTDLVDFFAPFLNFFLPKICFYGKFLNAIFIQLWFFVGHYWPRFDRKLTKNPFKNFSGPNFFTNDTRRSNLLEKQKKIVLFWRKNKSTLAWNLQHFFANFIENLVYHIVVVTQII